MSTTFSALVRFDILAPDIEVSVGGRVDADAVDELCQVIESSVSLTGKHACVNLRGAEVAAQTLEAMSRRCGAIADFLTAGRL